MKKTNQLLICSFTVIGLLFMFVAGCKKEADKEDCETNNYGVVNFNFATTTHLHSIIATQAGTTSFREKFVAIGVASDTMHLAPASWLINISKLDAVGLAIDSKNVTAISNQCSDETFTIAF